jgi:hypothetical protein
MPARFLLDSSAFIAFLQAAPLLRRGFSHGFPKGLLERVHLLVEGGGNGPDGRLWHAAIELLETRGRCGFIHPDCCIIPFAWKVKFL